MHRHTTSQGTSQHRSQPVSPRSEMPKANQVARWLWRAPLFAHCNEEALARMAKVARVIKLAPKAELFARGAATNGLYLVVSGSVSLVIPGSHGNEMLIELVGAGEHFGLSEMLLKTGQPVGARAATDARLLHLPRELVLEMLNDDTTLAIKLLTDMADRTHRLIREIGSYAFSSASSRLSHYLLALPRDADGTSVTLPVAKGTLASKLLMAPETLSRMLKELAENGLVAVNGQTITLKREGELGERR